MRLKKGFTIVEVSLVVAIGGLILVMALVAVPDLLRSTRDAQRKTDMETLVSALKKYQTNNNRGALPANDDELETFYNSFLGDNFLEPGGEKYELELSRCKEKDGSGNPVALGGECEYDFKDFKSSYNKLFVITKANCGSNNRPVQASNGRKFAVVSVLEVGDLFCIDG